MLLLTQTYRYKIPLTGILALDHVKENGNCSSTKLCFKAKDQLITVWLTGANKRY